MKKVFGTTRSVLIEKEFVTKEELFDGGTHNESEYNNYKSLQKLGVLAEVIEFKNGLLKMERVKPFLDFTKEQEGLEFINRYSYMDDMLRKGTHRIIKKYVDARDKLIETSLDYEEWQCPENWGVRENNELVLLDYSR